MTPKEEFGVHLTTARDGRGNPSFNRLERFVVREVGDEIAPTAETLRTWHKGTVDPNSVHTEVAVAIANFYAVNVTELHESFGPRVERGRALLAGVSADASGTPASTTRRERRHRQSALDQDSCTVHSQGKAA